MSQVKRIDPEILKANALRVTNESVRYNFTAAEITSMKDELYVLTKGLSARTALMRTVKEILDNYPGPDAANEIHLAVATSESHLGAEGSKELGKHQAATLRKINEGYEIRDTEVYELEGEDPSILEYYTADGTFLWEKRIAGSRQMNLISSLNKTGTNE